MSTVLLIPPEDRQFHVWRIDELYFGGPVTPGTKFRPRVGDEVVDWDFGVYRVADVSVEGIPTLEVKIRFNEESSIDLDSKSLITALSQYQPNSATAVFFDDSTNPFTVTVDSRYPVLGLDSETMIFFRGTNTSVNGEVISQVFNANGDLVGNEVSLIAIDATRPAIKRPIPFNTTKRLTAGEIVTGVTYNAASGPTSRTLFVVQESAANRPADLAGVFIEDIRIKSPLLSPTDATLLLNKAGTSFATSLVDAEILYSDGTISSRVIDGNKMRLLGLNNFDTSALIRPKRIILAYYPDPSEPYINANGVGTATHISKVYYLANVEQTTEFALKLFAIPKFVNNAAGYKLEWRLCNLERDLDLDVTNDVVVRRLDGSNFITTDYGNKQELTISLAMDAIIPNTYNGHVHTQKTNITVELPTSTGKDPILIDYLGDEINIYGTGLRASAGTGTGGKIWFGNNKATLNEWLSYLYNGITALYDRDLMVEPPRPTHFRYEYEGVTSPEYAVGQWNTQLPKAAGINTFELGKVVNIVWLISNAGQWDVLGHSPLSVKLDLV